MSAVGRLIDRWSVAIGASGARGRVTALANRAAAALRAVPDREQRIIAALATVTAVVGHAVMGSMLPPRAAPLVWLSAPLLAVAILAAAAAIARSR